MRCLVHQTYCDASGQARMSRRRARRVRWLAHQTCCDVSGPARPSRRRALWACNFFRKEDFLREGRTFCSSWLSHGSCQSPRDSVERTETKIIDPEKGIQIQIATTHPNKCCVPLGADCLFPNRIRLRNFCQGSGTSVPSRIRQQREKQID